MLNMFFLLIGFFIFVFIYEKEGYGVDLKNELFPMALILILSLFFPKSLFLGIFAVLLMSACLDYTEGVISNAAVITAYFYSLSIAYFSGRFLISFGFSLILLFLFILFCLVDDGIGGGDIKFLAALSPGFPPLYALYFLIASLFIGLLTYPILKRKLGRFPLGPGILLGYLVIYLIFYVCKLYF